MEIIKRAILFYSGVESFNYFTDQISKELLIRGIDVFIIDLEHKNNDYYEKNLIFEIPNGKVGVGSISSEEFLKYMNENIDLVICFDSLGIRDDVFIDLWNLKKSKVVDIFMEHPLRFHPTLKKHPDNYFLLCCDRDHVDYVNKYFKESVQNVCFAPHAATDCGELDCDILNNICNRKYDILFSGTYYRPELELDKIDRMFEKGTILSDIYYSLGDFLLNNNSSSIQLAVERISKSMELNLSKDGMRTIFRNVEPIDWMVRMFYREKVISTIVDSGMDIWLLGRGWENHPSCNKSNMHHIADRIPFSDTFEYMKNSKININVMPWFKNGSHDRVLNSYMQGSLPITDRSGWLEDVFTDEDNILFYDLNDLDRLPEIINKGLSDNQHLIEMVMGGYNIVKNNLTWKYFASRILEL